METPKGHLHPISLMIREINAIFGELGFVFAEGPEMELIKYNFDMLNRIRSTSKAVTTW
jgi:phenylalanyl-tRNA synthetase alpha chain